MKNGDYIFQQSLPKHNSEFHSSTNSYDKRNIF